MNNLTQELVCDTFHLFQIPAQPAAAMDQLVEHLPKGREGGTYGVVFFTRYPLNITSSRKSPNLFE